MVPVVGEGVLVCPVDGTTCPPGTAGLVFVDVADGVFVPGVLEPGVEEPGCDGVPVRETTPVQASPGIRSVRARVDQTT